ncbi:MAG: adaptor protein MecA [Clostridiales bacterium]|jgi:adapter protein MecA 1/2|nr:adaptor protein MecA [Clostridiales bacterium]
MKIEKISDTQVKFILNQSDLTERNIKINELAYGSEKMQNLFREMLEQALHECGFQPESNVPLMIEAIPLSTESIMIIVTKVAGSEDFDSKLNLMPQSKEERKFVKRPLIENSALPAADEGMAIYSFSKLDDVTKAAERLNQKYNGTNCLYKMSGKYYLMIHNNNPGDYITLPNIEMLLCEYGYKHSATMIAKYYIVEHGEPIIKDGAVAVLADM